ncbi:erythromycin esterase family protein [Sporosarcina jiandibaonis]|uniref:erythromycin esterase family protein n=1 Tax=Sporosarcina jiandibaonis TaxID=2715535 RepID=UPI0015560C14|nr:erythromycin esterase family protein [Sporosarcina jiandibaonis]
MTISLLKAIQDYSIPFEKNDDLSAILESVGDANIVLLGEASHGTSEFYSVRAEISKRLIEEKGFSIIAVEGDCPPSRHVNKFIKGYEDGKMTTKEALKAFHRWPAWMWANEEVARLVDWLKTHNEQLETSKKVGFYGIDLYSLFESIEEVVTYLTHADPTGEDLRLAKNVADCFEGFNHSTEHYAMATAHFPESCTAQVEALFSSIQANEQLYPIEFEQRLNLKLNALVAKNAEEYYRTSFKSDTRSWNVRDEHMVEAINEIRKFHGKDAKVIVWEHNTHIGDARATTMKDHGMLNVGQLIREQNPEGDVYAIGFGTHRGTVIAAKQWADPFKVMAVPPAQKDSWEYALHEAGAFNKLLIFNEKNRDTFARWFGHRAIGVVYHPEYEAQGNYVPSIISERYDAFVFIDETKALTPLQFE